MASAGMTMQDAFYITSREENTRREFPFSCGKFGDDEGVWIKWLWKEKVVYHQVNKDHKVKDVQKNGRMSRIVVVVESVLV